MKFRGSAVRLVAYMAPYATIYEEATLRGNDEKGYIYVGLASRYSTG